MQNEGQESRPAATGRSFPFARERALCGPAHHLDDGGGDATSKKIESLFACLFKRPLVECPSSPAVARWMGAGAGRP